MRLRVLPVLVAVSATWLSVQPALAQVLTPSDVLRIRFTVDPSTFPVNSGTGQRRVPNLLTLTLGQPSGVTGYSVSLYDGEALLGTQATGPQGTFYFKAASSAFAVGTAVDFASIRAGSIDGRIDVRIQSGTLAFGPQVALGESFSANGFFGFGVVPSTAAVVTGTTPCIPLSGFPVDAGDAYPLAAAEISQPRVSQCQQFVDARITNNLSIWLGVATIQSEPEGAYVAPNLDANILEGLHAQNGLLPPCKTPIWLNPFGDPNLCEEPGAAAWTLGFPRRGTIRYKLAMTWPAAKLNIIDLLLNVGISEGGGLPEAGRIGLDLNELLTFADELSTVPAFQAAATCLQDRASSARVRLRCLVQAVVWLVSSRDQLRQIRDAFANLGLSVAIGEIIQRLTGVPIRAPQMALSLAYFGFYLGAFSDDPTALIIDVRAR